MIEINDPQETKTRLNDYVTVTHSITEAGQEWREEEKEYRENALYDIYVSLTLGDTDITYYITGSLLTPIEDWTIMDIYISIGPISPKSFLINRNFENLETSVGNPGNESLRTWLKQFREKARV